VRSGLLSVLRSVFRLLPSDIALPCSSLGSGARGSHLTT